MTHFDAQTGRPGSTVAYGSLRSGPPGQSTEADKWHGTSTGQFRMFSTCIVSTEVTQVVATALNLCIERARWCRAGKNSAFGCDQTQERERSGGISRTIGQGVVAASLGGTRAPDDGASRMEPDTSGGRAG